MDIAERLKVVRGKLSQDEFAKTLNIHKNSLGRYERGESTPDVDVAKSICLTFGVSPQWLLLGAGEMHESGGSPPTMTDCTGGNIEHLKAKNENLELLMKEIRSQKEYLEKKNERLEKKQDELQAKLFEIVDRLLALTQMKTLSSESPDRMD